MITEKDIEIINGVVEEALVAFRAEVEKAGPKKSPAVRVRALIPPSHELGIPLIAKSNGLTKLDALTIQLALKELRALFYTLAMDVRTEGPNPETALLVVGGLTGWDTATAEAYTFENGKLKILKSESADSSKPRPFHLATVPNLMTPPDLKHLPYKLQKDMAAYVKSIVTSYRMQLPH